VDEAGNESPPGGPAHVSPRDTEPPGPIVGLRATLDAERRAVELGWEPSTEPDLRGYFVYRGDAPDSLIRVTPRPCLADECVFADDGYKGRGLLPGSSVVYAVSAVDLSYNEGPHVYTTVEVPDNVAPDAPFSLSARLQPDGSVRLAWMVRREEEIERFLVYRTVRDRTIVVAEPAGETSRWTDASIRRGVATEYRVTAVDVTGNESAPSEPVVVTSTDIVAPATPRGLRVDPAEEGALVRWEPGAEDDVAGYIVYRSRYRGARPERMTDGLVADARFEDPAGRPGMLYAVRAVDSSGNESGTSPAVVFEEAEP
jgi:fibronectin type 3 domain-containing protein